MSLAEIIKITYLYAVDLRTINNCRLRQNECNTAPVRSEKDIAL